MKKSLVIIGGGSAGLGATRAALALDVRPTLITDGPVGGDCTFTGCVPSKSLLSSSAAGMEFSEAVVAMRAVIDEIAAEESAEVLRGEGADVIEGRAQLVGPNTIEVNGERLEAEKIILALGSSPVVPPIEGIEDVEVLTNHSLFELDELPARMAIIGGGPIGVEMATAFVRFGSQVTLIEGTDRLLAQEEPAASEVVLQALIDLGVDVRLGGFAERFTNEGDAIGVSVDGAEIVVDKVLVAAGRRPNVDSVDLDAGQVGLTERRAIKVDDTMRTSNSSIYAAGDITALAVFTHAADEQARLAVGHALGKGSRWKYNPAATPRVTYTSPEVASVGVTEADAPKGSRVVELPLTKLDRAIVMGETLSLIHI